MITFLDGKVIYSIDLLISERERKGVNCFHSNLKFPRDVSFLAKNVSAFV